MKIQVTREDIQRGQKGQPSSCPVALAVARAFPGGNPGVGLSTVSVGFGMSREMYDLPRKAKLFISLFDGGSKIMGWIFVRPFTFEIKD